MSYPRSMLAERVSCFSGGCGAVRSIQRRSVPILPPRRSAAYCAAHGRIKSQCRDCGGKVFCAHGGAPPAATVSARACAPTASRPAGASSAGAPCFARPTADCLPTVDGAAHSSVNEAANSSVLCEHGKWRKNCLLSECEELPRLLPRKVLRSQPSLQNVRGLQGSVPL